jgi:hypothetical protein
MISTGLEEIRAVGGENLYRLRLPGPRPSTSLVEDKYNKYGREVQSEFTQAIREGRMSIDEAQLRHADEVWTRAFRDLEYYGYEVKYSKERHDYR